MSRNIRNGNSEHIWTANQTSRSKTIIWRWRSKTSGAQDTLSNPWCGVIWCDTIVTFSRLNVKENQLSSMLLPDSSLVLGVPSYWVFEVPVHTKHGWTSFHLRNVTPHLKHSVDICQQSSNSWNRSEKPHPNGNPSAQPFNPPCCHATPRPNGLQAPGESTCNDWMSFKRNHGRQWSTDWNHDSYTLNDTPSSGFTSKPTCRGHKLKHCWSCESRLISRTLWSTINYLQVLGLNHLHGSEGALGKCMWSNENLEITCWFLNLCSASCWFWSGLGLTFWGSELRLSTSACLQQKSSVSTGIYPEIQAIRAISWSHQRVDTEDNSRGRNQMINDDKWW